MFLANENFPRPSILLLRENNFDVESIQELFPGISDREVIERARLTNRIILTFDSDYGELIFRYAPNNPPTIVYFKDKGSDPLSAGKKLLQMLQVVKIRFENSFTVVETNAVRQRAYSKR